MKFTYAIAFTIFAYLFYTNVGSLFPYKPYTVNENFFPTSLSHYSSSELFDQWYNEPLRRMEEPSLLELGQLNQSREIYRFYYLPAMINRSTATRIVVNDDGTGKLYHSIYSGKWPRDEDYNVKKRQYDITAEQVDKISQFFDQDDFWKTSRFSGKLTINEAHEISDIIIGDGEQWVMEGLIRDQYYVIDRNSPRPDWPDDRDEIYREKLFDVATFIRTLTN